MSKYRFKKREEFIRDGLWDERYNCPDNWASDGEMNKYLGKDVPDELNVHCNKKEEFIYDNWLFQNTNYVLKEQQEYFNDLSQHIGRYIKALVNYPHSGTIVKKGDVGKIISKDKVDFPNHKGYHCTEALNEGYLGVNYELLPEDYSPEQGDVPERISFYVKYTEEFTEDLYNALWEWSKKNSEFSPRNFAESYEELKIHKFYIFDNWTFNCHGIYGNDRIHKYSYGVDNNKQNCEEEYSIEQVKKLICYKEPNVEFIPGKWYKWYQKNHERYHYGKVKRIEIETDTIVMSPWIIQCDDYNNSGTFDLSKAEQIQEISVEDIQEFLPNSHPDKLSKFFSDKVECAEFKKGEYIVLIGDGQSPAGARLIQYSNQFIKNHCYKVKESKEYLMSELDSVGSKTNGWHCIPYNPNKFHKTRNWRYATQEEIDEYEKRGKPYDVTEEAYEKQKSHIPEYIECTETQEYYFIKGNIYKVIDSNNLSSAKLVSNIDFSNLKAGTSLFCSMEINGKKYWKPSTKEKYDQQKSWLGTPEEITTKLVIENDPYEGATINIFNSDEVGQYLSTAFNYWKNVPTFVEKEFDIYGPTPDIE